MRLFIRLIGQPSKTHLSLTICATPDYATSKEDHFLRTNEIKAVSHHLRVELTITKCLKKTFHAFRGVVQFSIEKGHDNFF